MLSAKLDGFLKNFYACIEERVFIDIKNNFINYIYEVIGENREKYDINQKDVFILVDKSKEHKNPYYFYYFSQILPEGRNDMHFDLRAIFTVREKKENIPKTITHFYYMSILLYDTYQRPAAFYAGTDNRRIKHGDKKYLRRTFQMINKRKKKIIENIRFFVIYENTLNYNFLWENINEKRLDYNYDSLKIVSEIFSVDTQTNETVENEKIQTLIYSHLLTETPVKRKIKKNYVRITYANSISFILDDEKGNRIFEIDFFVYDNTSNSKKDLIRTLRRSKLKKERQKTKSHLLKKVYAAYFLPDRKNDIKYALYIILVKNHPLFIIRNEKIFYHNNEYNVHITKNHDMHLVFINEKNDAPEITLTGLDTMKIIIQNYVPLEVVNYADILIRICILLYIHKIIQTTQDEKLYLINTTIEKTNEMIMNFIHKYTEPYKTEIKKVEKYDFMDGIIEKENRYVIDIFNNLYIDIYRKRVNDGGRYNTRVVGIRIGEIDKNVDIDTVIKNQKLHSGFVFILETYTENRYYPITRFEIMY